MRLQPVQPVFVERIWGVESLAPYFPDQGKKIGEVWFQPSADFPILIKFLFTSEKLSVQVHPDDEFAREHENSRGKTEMWHILKAEPGAGVALGFRETIDKDAIRNAVADTTLGELLNWVTVEAGDSLFAEAGVVHAIGAGIVLCEIQQNSDVTYRLYDYGRPRELHLEKGLSVSKCEPYEGRRQYPITCRHFTTEILHVSYRVLPAHPADSVLIVLEGSGTANGEAFHAGQVWHVPAGAGPIDLTADPSATLLRSLCG